MQGILPYVRPRALYVQRRNPWDDVVPTLTTGMIKGLVDYKLANALAKHKADLEKALVKQEQTAITNREIEKKKLELQKEAEKRKFDAALHGLTMTPEGEWVPAKPDVFKIPGSESFLVSRGADVAGIVKQAPHRVTVQGLPGIEGSLQLPDKDVANLVSNLTSTAMRGKEIEQQWSLARARQIATELSRKNKEYGAAASRIADLASKNPRFMNKSHVYAAHFSNLMNDPSLNLDPKVAENIVLTRMQKDAPLWQKYGGTNEAGVPYTEVFKTPDNVRDAFLRGELPEEDALFLLINWFGMKDTTGKYFGINKPVKVKK